MFGLFITRNAENRVFFIVSYGLEKLYGVVGILVGRGFTLGAKAKRALSLKSLELLGKSVVLLFTQIAVRSSLGGQEQIVLIEFWKLSDA